VSATELLEPVSTRGARLLHGAPVAAGMRARVKADVTTFKNRYGYPPTLAIVVVGKDAPSAVYLQQIIRSCRNVGVSGRLVELRAGASADDLRAQIRELNDDPLVHGIIVQMPLPRRIPLRAVLDTIDPRKDVDGIHPFNAGLMILGYEGFLPATAQAVVEILRRYGYALEGLRAVVIGRSNVVGKPAAQLLLREHCTVTVCHRRTRDLPKRVKEADLLVVAAGHPGLVTGEMLKRGALVVDVGINVVPEGIVGDVDFPSAREVVAAITPVPGGLGPVTNAILMQHVVRAARDLARGPSGRSLRTVTRRSLRRVAAR
jgi:methylenetetrahydrofolate dehydrogenase (NADP+)/methenyltetrahydrofolate cyclohydrolase